MPRLQTYLSDDFAQHVRDTAEKRGKTASEHIREILRDYHHQENLELELEKTDTERRIEELVDTATEEIKTTSRWQKELMTKGVVNQIAVFELLKHNYPDRQRREALSVGASRAQKGLAELGVQLDELDENADSMPSDDDDDGDDYPWQNVGEDE